LKAKIYAIERERDPIEIKPITRVGVILVAETFEDEVLIQYIEEHPDQFVFKLNDLHRGGWEWKEKQTLPSC